MTRLGTATVLRGDARALPLSDASVDLIVTSPPYWNQRAYEDDGEVYPEQIGAEDDPREYLANLVDCTREWLRVLKPSGSLWVNLGDVYANRATPDRIGSSDGVTSRGARPGRPTCVGTGVRQKSLNGLPWRYALRCIDDLGLILRAEVVWSKPNGLPESVTDRVRRSHETWFHLVKQPQYFSAVDEIRRSYAPGDQRRSTIGDLRALKVSPMAGAVKDHLAGHPLGALPGSVWEIPTQPLQVPAYLGVDHFAAFPMEWPRRIILGWSPSGICTACGEGRRPVTEASGQTQRQRLAQTGGTARHAGAGRQGLDFRGGHNVWRTHHVTGEACACPDTSVPTRPAVVLDPFGGTGTTALVSHALGRHGITVDRSADYCGLAAWRTTDPGQLATALEVPKPPVQVDGQLDIFATDGAV